MVFFSLPMTWTYKPQIRVWAAHQLDIGVVARFGSTDVALVFRCETDAKGVAAAIHANCIRLANEIKMAKERQRPLGAQCKWPLTAEYTTEHCELYSLADATGPGAIQSIQCQIYWQLYCLTSSRNWYCARCNWQTSHNSLGKSMGRGRRPNIGNHCMFLMTLTDENNNI